MLKCSSVGISYLQGNKHLRILADFDLEVSEQPTALMGPSGSGKTSVLRCISGLQPPTSGEISIDGCAVDARGDSRVALVFQDHRLVEFISVADNLRLAAELRGKVISRDEVDALLADVALAGYEDRMPAELSGGEAQRVAIARAVATRSRVLLADEPTGSLDQANTELVTRMLIRMAAERGLILLVATHDPSVAELLGRTVRLQSAGVAVVGNRLDP